MATQADSVLQRFSSIATDPLRSFRFIAEFDVSQSGDKPFTTKIQSGSNAPSTSGTSTGWFGGFTNISGLNITTQSITYREGGYNTTVHQIPGMTVFSPVTFQRGVLYGNDQAMTWMRGLFAATSGDGLSTGINKSFRVNIRIYVMDHPNTGTSTDATGSTPKMVFNIYNAWITQLNYTDLNANDGAILFESMALVHEGLSVNYVKPNYDVIPDNA
jgi:phage tail-like protein